MGQFYILRHAAPRTNATSQRFALCSADDALERHGRQRAVAVGETMCAEIRSALLPATSTVIINDLDSHFNHFSKIEALYYYFFVPAREQLDVYYFNPTLLR